MKLKSFVLVSLGIGLLVSTVAQAQPKKDFKDWYGHVAGGYSTVIGDAEQIADDDINLNGGATYWPDAWPVGVKVEFGYNDFDLTREAVQYVGGAGGKAEIWSLTTGAVWSTDTGGKVDFQLGAGIGGYRLEAEVTEPGLYVGPICDPWFWYCYPGITPGDVIIAERSTTKLGYNVAATLNFNLDGGSQIYLQVQYHRAETKRVTEYVPMVVGFRW